MQIKQNSASLALVFFVVDSTDHVTGKTGLTLTVTLSKNGAAFASPAGAVSEIGNGFYRVAANATDSNTIGILALTATGTGADRCAMAYEIVANLEADSITAIAAVATQVRTELGTELGRIDAAISTRNATTPPTAAAVATQVRTELGTELGRIDAAISTRNATTPPTAAAVATQVRTELGTELGRIDAAISSRNATTPPTAAAVATQVRTELGTELGRIDAAISTRNATTPPTAAAVATQVRTELGTELGRIDAAISSVGGSSGGGATAGEIADAVCEELLAGHTAAGSVGAALAAASASGDPWATVIPAGYADGTAGSAIGRLNHTPPEIPVIVIPNPAEDANDCVVYLDTQEIDNVKKAGVKITMKLSGPAKTASGVAVGWENSPQLVTAANGRAEKSFERTDRLVPSNRTYDVSCPKYGIQATITLTTASFNLATLIPNS